jgi:1-acyl-sn-glycerol-3-phosphate acyltransferase|tara:strand:- start:296 stop:709 length:414 start_codon:yes stop_codon:yes gene_type:complete
MIRLYQYPVVDPTANRQDALRMTDDLSEAARTAEVPVAIFPEGTRTRDGDIGRFKKAALRRILQARVWKVYILVGDGFWKYAKFKDFLRGISEMNGEVEFVSMLEWNDPAADPNPFIEEIRTQMVARLARMRGDSIA